jgi:transposase-like protein
LFSNRKIFPRRRVAKAIGVKAYTLGLSLAQVKEFLEWLGYKVSREAIRQWYLEAGELLFKVKIKKRGFIAANETAVNVAGKLAWVWVSYEPHSKKILGFLGLEIHTKLSFS